MFIALFYNNTVTGLSKFYFSFTNFLKKKTFSLKAFMVSLMNRDTANNFFILTSRDTECFFSKFWSSVTLCIN